MCLHENPFSVILFTKFDTIADWKVIQWTQIFIHFIGSVLALLWAVPGPLKLAARALCCGHSIVSALFLPIIDVR